MQVGASRLPSAAKLRGAMANFNWRCPYCEHDVTITDRRYSSAAFMSDLESADGQLGVRVEFTVCPNEECQRMSITASLGAWEWLPRTDGFSANQKQFTSRLGAWRLKPWGNARAFPEYVLTPIRRDYEEACSIVELSRSGSRRVRPVDLNASHVRLRD